jgi:uroporphyrinogen-III synthase
VASVQGLRDRVLAITREEREAQEFFSLIEAEGGRAIAIPAIEIVPAGGKAAQEFLDLLEKKRHDYCAFMSVRAAKVLVDLAGAARIKDALKSTLVIAVGPNTRQELEKHGIAVDLIPGSYSSIGLVEMLAKKEPAGKKIIIPRSGEAGGFARKALSDLGMGVDEVFMYGVRARPATAPEWQEFRRLAAEGRIDAVVFTSASNVSGFFDAMKGLDMGRMAAISIGPFTSAELDKRKVRYVEAGDHTVRGTVDAAKGVFRNRPE